MPRGMPERRRRGTSLATQVTVAGVGFGLLVAVVFGLLVHAVREQRDATRRTTAATDIVAAGNRLERLVIDTETGQRGFVISGDPRFLAPLTRPGPRSRTTSRGCAPRRGGRGDERAAWPSCRRAVAAYLRDWSDRVVAVARVDRPRARRLVSGGGGQAARRRAPEPVRRAAGRPAAGGRRPGRPRQRPRAARRRSWASPASSGRSSCSPCSRRTSCGRSWPRCGAPPGRRNGSRGATSAPA